MNLFNALLASILMHLMILTWIEHPSTDSITQAEMLEIDSEQQDMGIDYSTLTDEEIYQLEQELEQLKQELKELVEEEQRLLNQKSREFELDMEDLFRRPTWKYPNGDIEI